MPFPPTSHTDRASRPQSGERRAPDPRNVFQREPLVVPQLFVDLTPPWYRRAPAIVLATVFVLVAVTMGGLVARFGVAGLLRAYARLFR